MSYKHFGYGPWDEISQAMGWHKLKLLLEYPEQYELYFGAAGITPPDETNVDQYLFTSLLGQVPPWWAVLQFEDRRAAGYKAAAADAKAQGLFPILHHEFDTISELALMVVKRHPDLAGLKLQSYTKQTSRGVFAGLHLVDATRRVILPKLEAFAAIPSRSQNSMWEEQANVATWLTGALRTGVLVVDEAPPGRSVIVEYDGADRQWVAGQIEGRLGFEYHSRTTMSCTRVGQVGFLRPWVSDKRLEPSAEFKAVAATVIDFGKYKGKTLDEVGSTDEGLHYLEWLLDQAGAADDRPIVLAMRTYLADPVIRKAIGHRT